MSQELGRSIGDRVKYLAQGLTDEDRVNHPKIENFIKIWSLSTGGSFDINEHSDFFQSTNDYALAQMNKLFTAKFNCNIDPLKN